MRSHWARRAKGTPIAVETDHGSASSTGPRTCTVWMLRLHRGGKTVTVATGGNRAAADRLAKQLRDLDATRGAVDPWQPKHSLPIDDSLPIATQSSLASVAASHR